MEDERFPDNDRSETPGPLAGLRVLDLTSVVMGPYATQLLGDYGADVIKVEAPDGDVMRLAGPMRNSGMGHLYMSANRSKRSLVIDLKTPRGRDLLLRLARDVDVLVYNIRPAAMKRLGLAYEALQAVNPRLLYVGAFGFSQRGPNAARPAYDDLIQGMAGIPALSLQAGASEPRYAPVILADRVVGLHLAIAVLAGLHHRGRTGMGQRIDVPMYETMVSLVLGEHLAGEAYVPPLGETGNQRSLAHSRKPFRTTDGFICVLIYNDKQWAKFFEIIGRPEIFEKDGRFRSQGARLENVEAVYGFVADVIAARSTDDWLGMFGAADIPAARMNGIEDILDDDHLQAIGFLNVVQHPSEGLIREIGIPTEWSGSPPALSRHAPRLGENSVEVLQEWGFSASETLDLLRDRIVIDREQADRAREAIDLG